MKRFLFALFMYTGALRLIAFLNRRKVTILCYHSVTAQAPSILDDPHKLHLPASLFAQHLEYLNRFYQVISLDEYLASVRDKRQLPDYSVVLTFEDGVRNFFTVVAPQLKRMGFPATVFVITGETSLASSPALNHKWQAADDHTFLSWQDIDELAQDGIQFGSHTCSHPRLTDLPLAEAERELSESLAALADRVQQKQFPLSYPYGQVSPEIRNLAQHAGYACGMTTIAGGTDSKSDLFRLQRTVIASDDGLATFAARVSGLTSLAGSLRRKRPPAADYVPPYDYLSASPEKPQPGSRDLRGLPQR